MGIARIIKVALVVPRHRAGELRKAVFKDDGFHPIELEKPGLGEFAFLSERIEQVITLGQKRFPKLYGASVFSQRAPLSTRFVEPEAALHEFESLMQERDSLVAQIASLERKKKKLQPYAWISVPISLSSRWKWVRIALVSKSKDLAKMLNHRITAVFEGPNATVLAYPCWDQETEELIAPYLLEDELFCNVAEELRSTNEEIEQLATRLQEVESSIDRLLQERADFFKQAYDYYHVSHDYARLISASVHGRFVGMVFGYVTEQSLTSIKSLVDGMGGCIVELPVEEGEVVPTKLENPPFLQPYEAITLMYGPPQYGTFDPTPFTALWWNAFIGFMLGDAGYGLLLTLVGAYGSRKWHSLGRTMALIRNIGIAAMIVGILTWSWFSAQPFMKDGRIFGVLRPLNLGGDINFAMILVLVVGVLAQFYAMGIRGWRLLVQRDYLGFWSDTVCWWGLLGSLIWMLLGGGSLASYTAVFFALNLVFTQGRTAKGFIGKLGLGLISLYGIMSGYGVASFLGDVLSYSRLLALNLTGSFMGAVFNGLSLQVMQGGLLGSIAGLLMLVLFQLFNFAISILGAFVHSIRLVFLEMYGRFYEGNGELFRSFKRTGRYYFCEEVDYE
ncbi:V-type ATP synthase subunit I [Coprothermobacteraceae bacterium]|nr:V-type ATP synthase subunit I [Coprothermobacteraceae bacterium]